jgi:signal peptidase I
VFNWKDRKILKEAREFHQSAGKWLRLNRDLLTPGQLANIRTGIEELQEALQRKSATDARLRTAQLETQIDRTNLKTAKHSALRENIEVFLVAAIVAMGVRTFFVQPFKIPTGSMQPTLYGVFPSRPPESEYRPPHPYTNGKPGLIHRLWGITLQGKIYEADGWRTRGDHVFVDKFTYHFRHPKRGDVVVFDTGNIIELPPQLRGKFYIKRLVALAGDTVQINEPYLKINGEVLDERLAFRRIYSQQNGYSGYVLPDLRAGPKYFRSPSDVYTVPRDHFFALGDNSRSSLDGRFWGSVPNRDLVGRAFFVYWPFSGRTGLIE